jgi:hypothetical protein
MNIIHMDLGAVRWDWGARQPKPWVCPGLTGEEGPKKPPKRAGFK